MITQDWIIPGIVAALILDLGLVWAMRLRRRARRAIARATDREAAQAPVRRILEEVKQGAPLLIGGAVTLASTRLLNPMLVPEIRWTEAPFLTAGGIMILSGAYPFAAGRVFRVAIAPFGRLTRWFRLAPGGALTICAALAFAILAAIAANHGINQGTTKVAAVCWGLGILLMVLGVTRVGGEIVRPTPRLVLGLATLTSVAFLLRATATSSIPAFLSGDESIFALASTRVLSGAIDSPFVAGPHSFPTLFVYYQAIPILLLGHTTQAIRILSALGGALTVAAVYMLGRSMFDHKAGLWSAIFLAFSHFHIHFSRLGLNNIWDGLWFVLALGGLWHGWKTGRRTSFVLAGLALGMCQYFYATSRVLLIIVPLWMLIMWRIDRGRSRKVVPDLVLTGLIAIVTTLPLVWYYAKNPDIFLGLIRTNALVGPGVLSGAAAAGMSPGVFLASRLIRGFGAYTSVPLVAWYQPGTGILQGGSIVLFVAGLVILGLKFRDARGSMLALWLIAFGILGGLTESTPAAQRYVPAVVAASLVIGLGLSQAEILAGMLWPRRRQLLAVLSVVIVSWLSLRNFNFYFFIYNFRLNFDARSAMSSQHIADYIRENPEVDQVVFFGNERDPGPNPNLAYLAPQIDVVRMVAPWGSPENPRPTGHHLLFAFLADAEGNLPSVMADYPGGLTDFDIDRDGTLVVALYEAPDLNR
jgi:4-amino-4-deoxy-L-arabinose transferase-like glycosyltransferase